MKTLISNFSQPDQSRKNGLKTHQILLSFSFYLLSFLITGSTVIPQQVNIKSNEIRGKRLDLLEKLESGNKVSTEDINSSMGDMSKDSQEPGDCFFPEIISPHYFPGLQSLPPLTGPFFYRHQDGTEHVIISDSDIKEMHKKLKDTMEELRKDINSFRNSEDFLIIHNELQKWNDNFRKELDNMKEELLKSVKETRSKGIASFAI
jgi:hypothetical protein